MYVCMAERSRMRVWLTDVWVYMNGKDTEKQQVFGALIIGQQVAPVPADDVMGWLWFTVTTPAPHLAGSGISQHILA